MNFNPNNPITFWVLITFVSTVLVVGIPLLTGLLNYRRSSKENQNKDITTLINPLIESIIKTHNEEKFAHPATLSNYITKDHFDLTLKEFRAEINNIRVTLEVNETYRKEDVKQFREDLRELKNNLSNIIGRRSTDTI